MLPTFLLILFFVFLILLSLIDAHCLMLPDVLTLSLLWIGLLLSAWDVFVPAADAILGASIGYSSLYLLSKGYFYVKGIHGLGLGDAKLTAAIGAWTGYHSLPKILLLASLLNLSWAFLLLIKGTKGLKTKPFPFAPALAISSGLMMSLHLFNP